MCPRAGAAKFGPRAHSGARAARDRLTFRAHFFRWRRFRNWRPDSGLCRGPKSPRPRVQKVVDLPLVRGICLVVPQNHPIQILWPIPHCRSAARERDRSVTGRKRLENPLPGHAALSRARAFQRGRSHREPVVRAVRLVPAVAVGFGGRVLALVRSTTPEISLAGAFHPCVHPGYCFIGRYVPAGLSVGERLSPRRSRPARLATVPG